MSFSVNRLDVVFFQRKSDNSEYEQVNISGSSAMFYLDENGVLQADQITKLLRTGATTKASLQSLGNNISHGDPVYSVDQVTVGRPNRLAKYVSIPNSPLSYQIVDTQTRTQDTKDGITIGKADWDKSVNATLDISGTVIITGSLTVTGKVNFSGSSISFESSSYSLSSSYASFSTQTISASWAPSSIGGDAIFASRSFWSTTSSYASSSTFSEYSQFGTSASYSLTSSYISGTLEILGAEGYYIQYTSSSLSYTSSIRQVDSSSIETFSSLTPSVNLTFSLGNLIKRWSWAFINSISSSVAYIKSIYGGSDVSSSLTLQGSSTGNGTVYINPDSSPVVIGTNVLGSGSLTIGGPVWGTDNAFFSQGTILFGAKNLSEVSTSFSDAISINVPSNESIYSKIYLSGKWVSGGPVGYYCESFLQKGDFESYVQPGIILNQYNNNADEKRVFSQILDTTLTSSNSVIKIQLKSVNGVITSGSKLIFELRGNFTNVI